MSGYPLIQRASKILTPLLLAIAFSLEQLWLGTLLSLGLWFWGWLNNEDANGSKAADLTLLGVAGILLLGALLGLAPYLLVAALLSALVGWDLSRFQKRIAHAPLSEGILDIEQQHLRLLGAAVLGGGAFAGILLVARLHLSFEFALALGVILVIIFAEIVRLVRSKA